MTRGSSSPSLQSWPACVYMSTHGLVLKSADCKATSTCSCSGCCGGQRSHTVWSHVHELELGAGAAHGDAVAHGKRKLLHSGRSCGRRVSHHMHGCAGVEQAAGRADVGGAAVCPRCHALSVAIGEPQVAPGASTDFRNKVMALASSRQSEQKEEQQQPVVACVKPWRLNMYSSRSTRSRFKVVDIDVDLSSFVPSWFWKSGTTVVPNGFGNPSYYSIVAAAHGLVCISNNSEAETTRHCMLNPLTRTCKVLPPVPFTPMCWSLPTPTALTIFGYRSRDTSQAGEVHVATYNLASSASASGGGGWDLASYKSDERQQRASLMAACAGETYLSYDCPNSGLLVLARRPGPGGRLVRVAALEEPSLAVLGVNASRYWNNQAQGAWGRCLVAHRGAVFFVRRMMRESKGTVRAEESVVGVWRLARERLQWEAVARLDAAELDRLVAADTKHDSLLSPWCGLGLWGACGVREFVYFWMDWRFNTRHDQPWGSVLVWLNLDTGEWEATRDEKGMLTGLGPESFTQGSSLVVSKLVELRPDLFL